MVNSFEHCSVYFYTMVRETADEFDTVLRVKRTRCRHFLTVAFSNKAENDFCTQADSAGSGMCYE